jgi:hypothetical protein
VRDRQKERHREANLAIRVDRTGRGEGHECGAPLDGKFRFDGN